MSNRGSRNRVRLRAKLAEAQNQRCVYCFRRFNEHGHDSRATIDHIQTKCTGGGRTYANSVAACWKCNNERGNQNAQKFARKRYREIQSETHAPDPAQRCGALLE